MEDKLNLKGHILGPFSALKVDGSGDVFDGKVNYTFVKIPKKFSNMNVVMQNVESKKLLKFLKKRPLIEGLADVNATFEEFSSLHKNGETSIYMKKAFMHTIAYEVPFVLNTKIDFKNIEYCYDMDIDSSIGTLVLTKGRYYKSTKKAEAKYELHLTNLAYFEKFLKRQYQGGLDTNGTMFFDKGLYLHGHTNKFGGDVEYSYSPSTIDARLEGVSLIEMLQQFSYPILFTAQVYGDINYDRKEKFLLINTALKKTKFKHTALSEKILKATEINVLLDEYNQSSFLARYQKKHLDATLKIDNGINHIYLKEIKMNALTKAIDAKFEIDMQEQEFYGTIYGDLRNPQVSLDVKKLLKYQVNKQVEALLGTEKRDSVKEKLNNAKRDVLNTLNEIDTQEVKSKAKSFIKGLFE